nr:hypothetical protein [uncultured Devosia sp.]
MAASTASTCNSCVFFEDHSDASAGVCRAHPPVPSSVESNKPAAIWPLVKTDDWCGQHTAGRS